MNCSNKNFPLNTFYNSYKNDAYCFYRHGQCITIKFGQSYQNNQVFNDNKQQAGYDRIYYQDGKYIIAQQLQKVQFLKREYPVITGNEENHQEECWKLYHQLNIKNSQISFIEKASQLIVTKSQKIYIYHIDSETNLPSLINVMFNFMQCYRIQFSPNLKFCITENRGQEDFSIYMIKQKHNFKVSIQSQNYEESLICNMGDHTNYCILNNNTLTIYNEESFYPIASIQCYFDQGIQAQNIRTHEESHQVKKILNLRVSTRGDLIAVSIGNKLERKSQNHIIYFYSVIKDCDGRINIELKWQRTLPDELIDTSINFEFSKKCLDCLYFIDEFQIYSYNFHTQKLVIQQILDYQLMKIPEIFIFNDAQTVAFVAAGQDVLFAKLSSKSEVDVDQIFGITEVKACKFIGGKFYILANKYKRFRGVYFLRIDEKQLNKLNKKTFILKYDHQSIIGDANICNLYQGLSNENQETEDDTELLIFFKVMWLNNFSIYVLNKEKNAVIFRHETYHIWESPITGCLLSNNDFLILSKDGITVLSISKRQDRLDSERKFNNDNNIVKLHPFQQCNYLKVKESNFIYIHYDQQENQILIEVREPINDYKGAMSRSEQIYCLKICTLSLQELLLLQGLFTSTSSSQIAKLINQQGNPALFYQSYLEFDLSNIIQLLSFDSKSIKQLLNKKKMMMQENNQKSQEKHTTTWVHEDNCFNNLYPLFYKIRKNEVIKQEDSKNFKSAIDIALKRNQIVALTLITQYIVEHQNSYNYAFLFENNFVKLLKIGIDITELLQSEIFCHRLEFDEWPQTHTDDSKIILPYNDSDLMLRHQYHELFDKHLKKDKQQEYEATFQSQSTSNIKNIYEVIENIRIHKIRYSLFYVPAIDDPNQDLMDMIGETHNIQIFSTELIKSLIEFKYHAYAGRIHFYSTIVHTIRCFFFIVHVNNAYIQEYEQKYVRPFLWPLMFCHLYFTIYEIRQANKQGWGYFRSDPWNYIDIIQVIVSHINWIIQYNPFPEGKYKEMFDYKEPIAKIFMIFNILLGLVKTFYFLRMIKNTSSVVIMIIHVMKKLSEFLFFDFVILAVFSNFLSVLGLHKYSEDEWAEEDYYVEEYKGVHGLVQNLITVFRYQLGDLDLTVVKPLTDIERSIFWITWVGIVILTNIVFLNFIIAVVSEGYDTIQQSVNQIQLQEKAQLISESEAMMAEKQLKNKNLFPKFLLIREVDDDQT